MEPLTGEIAIIHNEGDNWYLQAGSKPGEYIICIGPQEEEDDAIDEK